MDKEQKTFDFRTIVMSDVHLGSKWSKSREATAFIRNNSCETLILCGDIIDGWAIMRGRGEKWKRNHTSFIKALLDIAHTTRIIYVRGNHDDFLDRVTPINFLNMEIINDYIYTSGDKRYYVIHGDIFDSVTSRISWLAKLGDIGYSLLLTINRIYNKYRMFRGLPYYSIARAVKDKVKSSLSALDGFETQICELAKVKECDGVICGHIHRPDIKDVNGIKYLNSGDWMESLTALTEDYEGNWVLYREDVDHKSPSFMNPDEEEDE
ncbi:MAG: UDP-2,3-diacylglucosamine diphosphatase [Rikenellaceae bacterium]